jgi:hypothetical protein
MSFAVCKVITLFPFTFRGRPVWTGYWQDRNGRQNLPKLLRCFGQIFIDWSCSSLRSNNPARANISWYSLSNSRDKWHPARWPVTISLQETSNIHSELPRSLPHSLLDRSCRKHFSSIFWTYITMWMTMNTTFSNTTKSFKCKCTIYNNVIAFFCYINRMTLWSKQSIRAKYRQTNYLVTQFLVFSSMKQYSNTTVRFICVLAGSNLWRWREYAYFKSGSCNIYRHSCLHWSRF